MVENSIVKLGPVGSNGIGRPFDYKGCEKILSIIVCHDFIIHSIQFQYADENGALLMSDRLGNNCGNKFDVVKLNYPGEYITCISGHFKNSYISSITFGTNYGKYGPFGQFFSGDKEFSFHMGEGCRFAGLHGTADNSVRSIGVYVKLSTTLDNSLNKNVVKPKKENC